jgi:hypothetical protein
MLHGAVVTRDRSVRAIVAGPVSLRAYADVNGGRVFVATDCRQPDSSSPAQPVPADRRLAVEVPLGRMACLATDTARSFELLWRARPFQGPLSAVSALGDR